MTTKRDPLMAFVKDAADIAVIKAFATGKQYSQNFVFEGGVPEACEFLKEHTPPDMLMVEIPNAAEASGLLDQLANVVDPNTKVVVVGDVNEYSFFTWLTEIGIAHYFLKPLTAEALNAAYTKILTPAATGPQEKPPGKVVGIVGGKGGVGSTSISILLAAIVARKSTANVALIDLNPQDGSISALLDLEPCRGVHDALEKPDRIDELLLDRLLIRADDRFHILSAEESLASDFTTHPGAAVALLSALRKKYDVVVVDVSYHLTPFTKQCIRLVDECVVVTDMTLLGLRGTMRVFDWLEEALKGKPVQLVTNKVGLFEKHEVSEADIAKSVKHPASVNIPNAPSVFMEIANGIKVLDNGDAPGIVAISKLATLLFPEHVVNETEDGSRSQRKSFLSILKKK